MRLRRLRPLRPQNALLAACVLLAAGCSAWHVEREAEGWQLLRPRDVEIDGDAWADSFAIAHAAVQERLGPFDRPIRVHAWSGREGTPIDARPEIASDGLLAPAGDLGPARVSAFHVRPEDAHDARESAAEIYLVDTDPAAAVHELVHVRLAELDGELPLWFEEGLACLYADGLEVDGDWHVDGLACWPWTQLRGLELHDDELARLLALKAGDNYDARDNRLVHFVGWALVFDLARRRPQRTWREWYEAFERAPDPVAETRVRLDRTLDPNAVRDWLARLTHSNRGARLAAAKGTWKLASATVIDLLLDELEEERDPEVRATFALNALLAAGETKPGWFRWQRLREQALPVLVNASLPDPDEQRALRAWAASLGDSTSRALASDLEPFARLWRE